MASSAVTSTSSQKKSIAIYYKIEDLKQTSKKFIFKDTNVWQKHYELLEVYKKLILVDLDYALEKRLRLISGMLDLKKLSLKFNQRPIRGQS